MSVQKEWRVDIAPIDYEETKPQLQVVIDYDRAAELRVTVSTVCSTLEVAGYRTRCPDRTSKPDCGIKWQPK